VKTYNPTLRSLITYILLSLIFSPLSAQEAENIRYIRETGYLGADYYGQQSILWKERAQKNDAPVLAWFNYFMATEYSFIGGTLSSDAKKKTLKGILKQVKQNHDNTFEYLQLKARVEPDNMAAILKAQQLIPEDPEPYTSLIRHAAINGEKQKFSKYTKALYETASIHPALMDYNYNMLMSTAENAVLLTNGDNDTYPTWLLQDVKSIRTDVTVINIYLAKGYPGYLALQLNKAGLKRFKADPEKMSHAEFLKSLCEHVTEQKRPIYLAATVFAGTYEEIKDQLFTTGLTFRYSKKRFDNVAEIDKYWKQYYRLDSLTKSWYSEQHISDNLVNQLNMNYISPALALANKAEEANDQREADRFINIIKMLAERADQLAEINDYLNNKSNE